jgi:Na+/H+-translocating membrane pyrophosphatase
MSLPFLASLTLFDPIVDGGCALASLDAQRRPEVKHRSIRMNQAALTAGAVGRAHLLAVSALLGLLAVVHLSRGTAALGETVAAGNIAVLSAGAVLGVALILGFGGAAMLHAARTASELTLELQRQLEGFIRDKHGNARLPDEFRPRYNEHLSVVCQRALSVGAFVPLSVLLFPALLVATIPRFGDGAPAQAALLLTAVLALTTTCGFVVSLTAEGVWSLVSAARRHTRATDPAQLSALNLVEGVAEFAGNTISPSAQLAAKAVLAMSLAAALVLF